MNDTCVRAVKFMTILGGAPTCPGSNIKDLLDILNRGVEELAVAQLHQHGMLHVLAVELIFIVRDGIAAILEVLVAATMLDGVGIDRRGDAGGSAGAAVCLISLGTDVLQLELLRIIIILWIGRHNSSERLLMMAGIAARGGRGRL